MQYLITEAEKNIEKKITKTVPGHVCRKSGKYDEFVCLKSKEIVNPTQIICWESHLITPTGRNYCDCDSLKIMYNKYFTTDYKISIVTKCPLLYLFI